MQQHTSIEETEAQHKKEVREPKPKTAGQENRTLSAGCTARNYKGSAGHEKFKSAEAL